MKKALALVLALLCMATLMVACGDDNTDTSSADSSAASSADSSAASSAESSEASKVESSESAAESSEESKAESFVEDPSVEDPSVEDPSVEDPSVEDPSVEEPSVDDSSVVDLPVADDDALKAGIVGDWNYVEEGIVMNFTFNADGSMLCNMMGMDIAGVYTIADGKLTITVGEGDNTEAMFEDADIAITAEGLVVTVDGDAAVFAKGHATEGGEDVEYTGDIDEALIGTWTYEEDGETLEIVVADAGKLTLSTSGVTFNGNYLIEDGKLSITMNFMGETTPFCEEAEYTVDAGTLTIDVDGEELVLTKKA